MASVELINVEKAYPNGFKAIHDLNMKIQDKELLVLVGPSGCGKSTALRMIAGLEGITSGQMMIGDQCVNNVAPKDRDIAMVFQNYALYPHMTVYENIGFSLKMAKVAKDEADRQIKEAAAILELDALLDRKPGQLSGGQRQRVAMGRAIVRRPEVFLMDEPLSNLDAKLRVQMRAEIAKLQDRLQVTTVYVTHDQVEAMTMGDRVAVLKDGRLQQIDTPKKIYDRPVNVFVGAFIGSPSMNLIEGYLNGNTLHLGRHSLKLSDKVFDRRPGLKAYFDKRLIVGIRPEDFEDAALDPDAQKENCLTASVKLVEALGSDVVVHFNIDAVSVDAGDPDAVDELAEAGASLVARFHRNSQIEPGPNATVSVLTENIHFFDYETRLSIW